jgi:hypothetical protein
MLPRIFLGFCISSKLENKHIKCKNINNTKLKRLISKTLTLLRKCLINSLENLVKHRLGNETKLNRQGRQGLPQNQAKIWSPLHKTSPNSQLSQEHTLIGFWQPSGVPGD